MNDVFWLVYVPLVLTLGGLAWTVAALAKQVRWWWIARQLRVGEDREG